MKKLTRRDTMMLLGAAAGAFVVRPAYAALPKLEKKDTYKVGFAQTESNNPWRLAQTASMKAEAEKLGWQLVYTDAAGSAAKQVADVNSMIAQGVDVRGYMTWSLLDNLEWSLGYSKRFGITHVNFQTQERTIKDSGLLYAEIIKTHGTVLNTL